MVLFFTVGLGISIVGMAGLLGFKRYELVSGHVIFASARPALGSFFKHAVWWVEKELPALVREYTRRTVHVCKVVLQRLIARSILSLEHGLERVLHTVREQTSRPRSPGQASAFLREVAEHKRNLSHIHKPSAADVEEIAETKSEFEVE